MADQQNPGGIELSMEEVQMLLGEKDMAIIILKRNIRQLTEENNRLKQQLIEGKK